MNLKVYRHLANQNTGGHIDSLHIGPRHVGRLQRVSGMTGANGCFETKYTPSHISGVVTIEAFVSPTFFEYRNVFVGVAGRVNLPPGGNYELTGDTLSHPVNHFGTPAANIGLTQIADDYKAEYYGSNPIPQSQKIKYNDSSLEFGGKFDLFKRWENTRNKHGEHRVGINNDTYDQNIPRPRWARLEEIFINRGSTRTLPEHGANHWHLRFEFGTPQAAVERTPHMFIEDAFDAVLERQSSQPEYETWLSRLTTAKAEGQSQLISEAMALENQVFDSAEYIARERNDEEFINDVFWSHLFREPTEKEAKDWLDHFNTINAITQQAQRMTFLYDFENTPEFQSVISGIVDPAPPTR